MGTISAPKNLSSEGKKLWEQILKEYDIQDAGGLSILKSVCESLDRIRECQEIIDKEGMTVMDRFNQTKAHPLLSVERDARSQFLQAIKTLNLDLEPLADAPGRPGGGKAV